MKRPRSFLLLLLSLIAVLCSFTAWTVYREHRQERLNRDLIAAVKHNDTKAVVSMLNQGADANCHDEPYKPVPWWQMLRDRLRGKHPKPSTAPTPLMLAIDWKVHPHSLRHEVPPENSPLVQALLDHGAKVNVRGAPLDYAPLDYAIMDQKVATIYLLVRHGADLNPDPQRYEVPLIVTASNLSDSTPILAEMLKYGANVNQRDAIGDTALIMSAQAADVEAVRLLLTDHADTTLRGSFGTALSAAKGPMGAVDSSEVSNRNLHDPRRQQIIRLLKQAGAKE